MKILILASSSFAATGLPESLTAAGHEVWTFNRSPLANAGPQDLSGRYEQLEDIAAQALPTCDVLINYAIVKNGTIEQNIAMADLVMSAARRLGVKRFIHISSISVLPSITGVVNEDAAAVEAAANLAALWWDGGRVDKAAEAGSAASAAAVTLPPRHPVAARVEWLAARCAVAEGDTSHAAAVMEGASARGQATPRPLPSRLQRPFLSLVNDAAGLEAVRNHGERQSTNPASGPANR
jgi:hypothetical protein